MKKWMCMILAMLFLASAAAASAEDPYVFKFDGFPWGTTLEAVMEKEEKEAEDAYVSGDITMLEGSELPIGSNSYHVGYIFFKDGLMAMELSMADYPEDRAAALADTVAALSGEFGEPNCADYDTVNAIFEFFPDAVELPQEAFEAGYAWKLPDDRTVIFSADFGQIGIVIFDSTTIAENSAK